LFSKKKRIHSKESFKARGGTRPTGGASGGGLLRRLPKIPINQEARVEGRGEEFDFGRGGELFGHGRIRFKGGGRMVERWGAEGG